VAPVARSHHSANAQYDLSKILEMEGALVEFANVNPHAKWYFDVTAADGKVQRWEFTSAAPAAWRRTGLRFKDDLKKGMICKVRISPGLAAGVPIGILRDIEINGRWMNSSLQ
jgi:hypothetical protein